jgi:hypothetical protein
MISLSNLQTTRQGHFRFLTASFHRLLSVEGGMPNFLAASDWGMLRYSVMSTKFWPFGTVTGLMTLLSDWPGLAGTTAEAEGLEGAWCGCCCPEGEGAEG